MNDVQFEVEVTIRTKGGKRTVVGTGSAMAAPNSESVKEAATEAVIAAMRKAVTDGRRQRVPA